MSLELSPMQLSLYMDWREAVQRAEHCAMRINLGLYRNRIVHKGSHDGPLMTSGELLDDEMWTHQRHIDRANDLSEAFKGTLTEQDRKVFEHA